MFNAFLSSPGKETRALPAGSAREDIFQGLNMLDFTPRLA